jgi:hypothetical protein
MELTRTVLDDGERVSNTLFGMGMAVLATLNILEQHSLLKADSSIPNIPVTLSLVFQWISTFTDAMDNDLATQCDWPNMIVAYAEKNGIEIKGLYNVDEILEEYGTEDMKKADKKKVTDPPKADKFSFVTKVGPSRLILFRFRINDLR